MNFLGKEGTGSSPQASNIFLEIETPSSYHLKIEQIPVCLFLLAILLLNKTISTMTAMETRNERDWFSIGFLLMVLSFVLFLGKIGYRDYTNTGYPPFSNATVGIAQWKYCHHSPKLAFFDVGSVATALPFHNPYLPFPQNSYRSVNGACQFGIAVRKVYKDALHCMYQSQTI